ncbi:MAG: thymidylate kinase [Oscillospiraceae bacterium]|nr:thymidylate kinase [Oscillospiraceae bacterium]
MPNFCRREILLIETKGKLLVIDGLDGCGKSTQQDLLVKYLEKKGRNVCGISFPCYDEPSSGAIRMYLRGDFGKKPGDVNPYAASSFYAVDRYASFKTHWGRKYLSGALVVSARYVSSNIFHQMVKLPRSSWDGFINWAEDFEFCKLGLPRPDGLVFLDVETQSAARLLSGRYEGDESKKDIHERDLDYLEKCREAALYACGKLGYKIIKVSRGGNLKNARDIQEEIRIAFAELI